MCTRVCVPRLLVVLLLYKLLMTAKPNRENERSRSRLAEGIQENVESRFSIRRVENSLEERLFDDIRAEIVRYQLFVNYFVLGNVEHWNVFDLFTRVFF